MATDGRRAALSTLNRLMEICRDSEQGYRAAAEGLRNEPLRMLFLEYSQQRARLVSELQEEARRLGAVVAGGQVPAPAEKRVGAHIKPAAGEDEASVISECERGDDAAVRTYEEALEQENLPPEARSLIEKQYTQIKVAHDQVRQMEQAQH